MHHGMADLNARREAIENDPARFLLEDVNQLAIREEVFVVAQESCGQMAVEGRGCPQIILCVLAMDQQRVGAKDFIGQ